MNTHKDLMHACSQSPSPPTSLHILNGREGLAEGKRIWGEIDEKEKVKNSSERIVRWEEEHREWRLGGCCGKDFGETDEENLRIFGYVCMIYSFKALQPPFKKTYKKYRHYSLRCLELSAPLYPFLCYWWWKRLDQQERLASRWPSCT